MTRNAFVAVVASVWLGCAGPYSGNWWRSVSVDERSGFLAGYADCHIFDLARPGLSGIAGTLAERRVTEYYQSHPDDRGKSVGAVLLLVANQAIPPPAAPGFGPAESYPGPHGGFDGDYWRQMPPEHRRGFVEGYLECRKQGGRPLPRSADWYVPRITEWYRVVDDQADVERAPEKIADVLMRLASG